jgi:hypothetical protein
LYALQEKCQHLVSLRCVFELLLTSFCLFNRRTS